MNNINKVKIIKEYAEKHTALFTAVCSAFVAMLTVYFKLCYYSYEINYLNYFDIDIKTIKLLNDSTIFSILFYMLISVAFIVINYIGIIFYQRNKTIKYLLFWTALIFILLYSTDFLNINSSIKTKIILLIILSFISSVTLNVIVILNALSKNKSDLELRIENKYNSVIKKVTKPSKINRLRVKLLKKRVHRLQKDNIKIKRKELLECLYKKIDANDISYISDHIKTYKKHQNEAYKQENVKKSSENSKLLVLLIAITIIFPVVLFGLFGMYEAKVKNTYETIQNDGFFKCGEEIECVILYKNDEYMVLAPCIEENDKICINLSHQYRTKVFDCDLSKNTYKYVEIKKEIDLDKF